MEVLFHLWGGGLGQRLWRIGSLRQIPFEQTCKIFTSGWTLQELERVGAHGAQLEQGRGAKEEGGGEEGRLCQRSKVII